MNGLADEYYQQYLDTYYYDTDRSSSTEMAAQYRVSGLPTMIILDSSGQVARRLVGFTSEAQLRSAIETTLYR